MTEEIDNLQLVIEQQSKRLLELEDDKKYLKDENNSYAGTFQMIFSLLENLPVVEEWRKRQVK